MKERLSQWEERFNQLSIRERFLILGAAVLVIVFLGWQLLIADGLEAHTRLSDELDVLDQQGRQLETELLMIRAEASKDVDAVQKERLAKLGQQVQKVEAQLQQSGDDLIAPAEMAGVLRKLLAETPGLKLISLSSLPEEPLVPIRAENEKALEEQRINIYRHPLVVEFEGSYLAALDYLKRLEGLDRPLFWDRFELVVDSYPKSRIRIRVHTLSLGQGLIGV